MIDPTDRNGASTDVSASMLENRPPHRRRRRPILKSLAIVLGILVVLVIGIVAGDQYIARYFLAQQLKAIGINATGVDTLEISLLDQEVVAGPVEFRAADTIPGTIDRAGIKISFKDLFSQRALAQRIILEGIDFRITRTADGGFALNGVSLAQAMAEESEEQLPEPAADEEGGDWGAGLDVLELRNATIYYKDEARGDLNIEIDSLILNGFRTWEPDSPGTFDLDARVNNFTFHWAGEARPFGDTVVANFRGVLDDVELDKITQYTGPIGFTDRAGIFSSDTQHQLIISPEGRLELTVDGQLRYKDVISSREDGVSMQSNEAIFDLDIKYVLSPEGDSLITGKTLWTLEPFLLDLLTGTVVSTTRLVVEAPAVDIKIADEVTVGGQVIVEFADTNSTIDNATTVDAATARIDLQNLAVTVADATSVRVSPTVTTTNLDITVPEGPVITAATANLAVPALEVDIASETSIRGAPKLETKSLSVIAGDDAAITAATADVAVADFALAIAEETGLMLTGSPTLIGKELAIQAGAEIKGEALTVNLSPLTLKQNAERLDLAAKGDIDLTAINVASPESAGTPAVAARVDSVDVQLAETAVSVEEQRVSWKTAADTIVKALRVQLGDGSMLTATVDQATVRQAAANDGLSIGADDIDVSKLDVTMNDTLFAALGGGGSEEAAPAETSTPDAAGGEGGATFRVGRAVIGNGSVIRFKDTSAEPPVEVTSTFERLEVSNLNTGDPDAITEIAVAANINEFTKANISGWMSPMAAAPNFDMTARIVDLELPTFSPYVAKAVGVNVEGGVLSTKSGASASAGQLDGLIETEIKQIELSALSKEEAERLAANVGLPIKTAVALLKDRNGVIDLSIPVSGDLSDPAFDISDAIWTAVGGALTKAVTAPFSLLFAPIDAIAGAASGSEQPFRPITFEAELAKPDADGQALIAELRNMLIQRPELSLRVCGRATAADRRAFLARNGFGDAAQQPTQAGQPPATTSQAVTAPPPPELIERANFELEKLAKERTRVVRRAVVDDGEIQNDRLRECRAFYNADDANPPRAELAF